MHLSKNKNVLGIFDNFNEIYKYIIMMARFYSHIYYEKQIVNSIGFTHSIYHPRSCCCKDHLGLIQANDSIQS